MNGIYAYYDTEKSRVIYIGKDSYINNKTRHKEHLYTNKNRKHQQQIDIVIQNNPKRYKYIELVKGNFTEEELNEFEIYYIKVFKTYENSVMFGGYAFNFTEGGEGAIGYKHSQEVIDSFTGANHPLWGTSPIDKHGGLIFLIHEFSKNQTITDIALELGFRSSAAISTWLIRHHLTLEDVNCGPIENVKEITRRRIIENHVSFIGEDNPCFRKDLRENKDKIISYYNDGLSSKKIADMFDTSDTTIQTVLKEENIPRRDNKGTNNGSSKLENRIKYSKKHNTTGYLFVSIRERNGREKKIYRYRTRRNGKPYIKESVDILKLKEKVLKDAMPWYELNENGQWKQIKN